MTKVYDAIVAAAKFFHSTATRAVYRRQGGEDRVFAQGEWKPTTTILDYMVGEDDDLEPVTESQAKKLDPQAFA